MSEYIEKARPDVAASERETEQRKTAKNFSASRGDCTPAAERTQSFLDNLPHDPEKALTAAQLGELLQISPRDVTRLVQRYRLAGVPLCASCGDPPGYFLATEPEQLARYLKSLTGRLREVTKTCDALSTTLDNMRGQSKLEGF